MIGLLMQPNAALHTPLLTRHLKQTRRTTTNSQQPRTCTKHPTSSLKLASRAPPPRWSLSANASNTNCGMLLLAATAPLLVGLLVIP